MAHQIRFGYEDPSKREYIDGVCSEPYRLPGTLATHTAPSGLYRLDIDKFNRQENPERLGSVQLRQMDYTVGRIARVPDGEVIAEVKRNYPHFWFTWISHPTGHELMVCGEDYQGYTVLDLCRGIERIYLPEEVRDGNGFCWVKVHPSPDGKVVAVEGCYWGWPYELVFFDFSQVDSLPLPELLREEDFAESIGWLDNETFAFRKEFTIRRATSGGTRT